MRIRYVSFIFKVRANRNSSETETDDKIRDQRTLKSRLDVLKRIRGPIVDSEIRVQTTKAKKRLKTIATTVRMSEFSCIII